MTKIHNLGKKAALVSARTGSTRLPGKACKVIGKMPMVLLLLSRLKKSKLVDEIIFCTTNLREDDKLAEMVRLAGYSVFRGENSNVVGRYVSAAKKFNVDTVVRVTGDCPCVDGESLDYCLLKADNLYPFDLATTKGCFPVGIDFELFPAELLSRLDASNQLSDQDREHVTLHMYNNPSKFLIKKLHPKCNWVDNKNQYTVDTSEDFKFILNLIARMDENFSIAQLIEVANRES